MLGQYLLLLLLAFTAVNCCAPSSPRRAPPPSTSSTTTTTTTMAAPIACAAFDAISMDVYNLRFPGTYGMTAAPPPDPVRVTCSGATPTIYYLNPTDMMVTQATSIECMAGQWMATNAMGGATVAVVPPLVRCGPMP